MDESTPRPEPNGPEATPGSTPQPTEQTGAPASYEGGGDETFAWRGADTVSGEGDDGQSDGGRSHQARDALAQLQQMIDNVATAAAPVARQIAAKAAELAAAAGDRAGPIARKAADVTEGAGARLAERSRALAEELRRDGGQDGGDEGAAASAAEGGPASGAPVGGEEGEAPSQPTTSDEPAEGSRESAES